MRIRKIAMNVVLVLIGSALALMGHGEAGAATLRTTPINSFNLTQGAARCIVTNGSTSRGTATVKLFSKSGELLDSEAETLNPHASADPTAAFSFPGDSPTYCECTVPSATSWRCSFVYMDTLNGAPSVITVIDGR